MSDNTWTQLTERHLSRRTMLNWSARFGVGAAGLALVGCGGDDDDDDAPTDQAPPAAAPPAAPEPDTDPDPEPEPDPAPDPEPDPEPEPATRELSIVIDEIALAGAGGSVTLINTSNDPVDLEGWFVCQFPNYARLPGGTTIAAGERLVVHANDGDNTATDIFVGADMGVLDGGGEIGIYSDGSFENADSMVAYVGWGGGGGRQSVAQAAGLWGDTNLDVDEGDLITWAGGAVGIDNYNHIEGGAIVAPTEDETAMASGKVIIQNIAFVNEGVVRLQNMTADTVSLEGWFLCQFPRYWAFPAIDLAPAAQLRIRLGAGDDTADTLHARGGAASLDAASGEIGLYSGPNFDQAADIVSYIAWGGGGGRLGVAQTAGIWGNRNLDIADGNVVAYTGAGIGADGYQIADSGTEGADF